jgi:hypothetical protein
MRRFLIATVFNDFTYPSKVWTNQIIALVKKKEKKERRKKQAEDVMVQGDSPASCNCKRQASRGPWLASRTFPRRRFGEGFRVAHATSSKQPSTSSTVNDLVDPMR